MNLTIRLSHCGGPDVLRPEQAAIPTPAAGEVLLRHTAIGVNFIDTYYRSGLYPLPLPSGLGSEAAAVVEAVGDGVDHLQVGDRVAYAGGAQGAYSQYRTLPAALLVKLPDDIDDDTAACVMLQGMTVEYLIRRFAPHLEPAFDSADYLQYLQWIHFAESSAMVPVLLKVFTQFEANAGTQLKFLNGYTQTEFDKVLGRAASLQERARGSLLDAIQINRVALHLLVLMSVLGLVLFTRQFGRP